ncbi:nip7 [Nucleospora cyclopteri]
MRNLKETEMEKVLAKLKIYLGDNVKDLLEEKTLQLNNQRVFLISKKLQKACSQIGRKQIISAGTILGKFTKTDNFRITITSLHKLYKYGIHKVWLTDSAENNFLYGNNALKSHIHKISESIPINAGIFVFNKNNTPLGFGLIAVNQNSYQKARGGDIVILNQSDNGEYIRNEIALA